MEVEKEVLLLGEDVLVVVEAVEVMAEGGSRIKEAYWLETFLWIADPKNFEFLLRDLGLLGMFIFLKTITQENLEGLHLCSLWILMMLLKLNGAWMGKYLVGERYRLLWLPRRGKGPRRCAIELGKEDHQAMGDDHLTMDVLSLVRYPLGALLTILLDLEVATAQGHTHLLQDVEQTILFHRVEDMKNIRDLQEVLHKNEMVITITDHILRDMKMLMEMISERNLNTRLQTHPACRSTKIRSSRSPSRYSRNPSGSRSRSADLWLDTTDE